LVQAHAYWRLKGLLVDLVIWNEDHGGYRQTLTEPVIGYCRAGISANVKEQPGGIFIRSADQISNEDRILIPECGTGCDIRQAWNIGRTGEPAQ
jgi:cyclic beta-1,2-glucan synthetase